MKKLKILFSAVLITGLFWGCEKDDICESGTPTTPSMVIEFYDNNNPTVLSNVTDLAVIAEGSTVAMPFTGVSKIKIPLKTTDDIAKYTFILDSKNPDELLQKKDTLTLNYTRKDIFISRACGFKTTFTLNNPDGIVQDPDGDEWIKEIVIQQHNILNEDIVHVKIFF